MKSSAAFTRTKANSNRSIEDAVRSAKATDLYHVLDLTPGVIRKGYGKNVHYIRPNGTGAVSDSLSRTVRRESPRSLQHLLLEEAAVLSFLRDRILPSAEIDKGP